MFPFSLEKAGSAEAAIALPQRGARYIAGGTTLVDLMRDEVERPERLIDINRLPSGRHSGGRSKTWSSARSRGWPKSPLTTMSSVCSR